jgi:predicted lipid-binding transport protein (Tim44 family)
LKDMSDRFLPRNAARTALAAIVPIILAACSSTPSPVAEISAAQTAVTAAEQADAAQHAPGDLDRARDKLTLAQSAMQEEEIDEARRLAEQALVDARLAEAKSRADVARRDANKVQAGMDELRSGPGDGTPQPLVLQ